MIKLLSGTVLNLSSRESTLIPPTDEIVHLRWKEEPGYILVVEKEAIFQTLCHSAFADNSLLGKKGVIITGKGQPDIATRGLVHLLSQELPLRIPILLLVDADVYGLEIASVYKCGSIKMRHESHSLTSERAMWLGLKHSDFRRFHIDPDSLLHISNMDYRKALHMLSRLGDRFPSDWKDELTRLVLMRRKAEIEILSQASPTTGCLWDTARSGPALIPYLLVKISEVLTVM
ncbi:Spo11/DNA topoisomerase VI subunit A [Cantharellus anzutake]|uniref:Spo11/DNA topoisomerase VI subunit A n=1 Tax=Cantharellus anzutake TaxID=1750568 RepID=UPI001903DEC7|nr:Spo11/DNA topoisomerase VI subunit A [Cantharellus anzutake]KAF8344323.1 Spo11/DNA topoisomerase VI subunit A [Cantharellus anzutake]